MKTSAKIAIVIVAACALVSGFVLNSPATKLAWQVVLTCLLVLLIKLIIMAMREAGQKGTSHE